MFRFTNNIIARITSRKFVFSSIWTAVILYLSLARIHTPEEISHLFPNEDKVVHFSMYFILCTFLQFEFRNSTKKNIIFWIMLYTFSFGYLMEILQGTLFTYRSYDIYDFLANCIGAITATLNYLYYKKTIKK